MKTMNTSKTNSINRQNFVAQSKYVIAQLLSPIILKAMSISLFLGILVYNNECKAQGEYANISTSNAGTFEIQTNIKNEALAVDGSPYLNDEWKSGLVYLKDGKVMEIEMLNLNIHKNVIAYMKGSNVYNSSKDLDVERFQIGNQIFIAQNIDNQKVFLQKISDGDRITLYKQTTCDFVAGQPSKGYIEATRPKYVPKSEYFAQLPGKGVVNFKLKKKEILSFMLDKESAINSFISKNNMNVKNESELIQVFDYYNLIKDK